MERAPTQGASGAGGEPPRMPASASAPPPSRQSHASRPSARKATLPRFLRVASASTARNLETCGLLLGREVVKACSRSRFVVETLLILKQKQHATSDTCAMAAEEGVLSFTEARGLITMGWTCTHAGFQQMLPESFAVVCALNFGFFRRTDPPGLTIVLTCTAKQAFHPHPDNTDKGHVQMNDAAFEIVDLW
ncbi:hypothetical protein DFH09DRAFT_1261922 [Mycena vulgaris]|nr:hypothetical protein DFH09DRAFT_1261922 [Mycena vulgaris]